MKTLLQIQVMIKLKSLQKKHQKQMILLQRTIKQRTNHQLSQTLLLALHQDLQILSQVKLHLHHLLRMSFQTNSLNNNQNQKNLHIHIKLVIVENYLILKKKLMKKLKKCGIHLMMEQNISVGTLFILQVISGV